MNQQVTETGRQSRGDVWGSARVRPGGRRRGPHISDERFSLLEAEVRDLRLPWEQRGPAWYGFNLLSALDEERLSDAGRRRLGEMHRACGMEQPSEPEGIVVGSIGPPLPREAAARMGDDNWLQAMAKYSGEREDWRTFTGGGT
jgi:hypothetical protein